MRQKLSKAVPIFILLSSSLLILRGMNLGIPMISPMVETSEPALNIAANINLSIQIKLHIMIKILKKLK